MTQQAAQRVLVALIVAACIAVTALWIVASMRRDAQRHRQPDAVMQGGAASTMDDGQAVQPRPLREFQLTDRYGQPFDSKDLKGKVWIASFFFTRCPTVCPQVLAQTSELQKRLSQWPGWKDIRLVSITVDPQHDTPAVLDERAKLWNADAKQWLFLTGDKEAIWSLTKARDGFMLAVGDARPGDAMTIAHSSRFVLIDAQHRVVGYYDALDEEKREAMVRELKRLVPAGDADGG